MSHRVSFDSQVFTYLLRASEDGYHPDHDPLGPDVARECVAALRVFLYATEYGNLVLLPTVVEEYQQIADAQLRRLHEIRRAVYFVSRPVDPQKVKALAGYYFGFHGRTDRERMDCRIVAEAELTRVDTLLTFDSDLIKDLKGRTDFVSLVSPSEFWTQINVSPGTPPKLMPSPGHPLNDVDWWKW
jgi:hypothetical protein